MSDITILDQPTTRPAPAAGEQADCQECVGSGGWFRYEPSVESGPGLLYLSCVGCRGSGRLALAQG